MRILAGARIAGLGSQNYSRPSGNKTDWLEGSYDYACFLRNVNPE